MKREFDIPDLRAAFPPESDACRDALMRAARSVKEEEPVKKVPFRAVAIAALIIIATMAMAVAAGSLLGWTDFYKEYGTTLPEGAQRIMQGEANTHTFTVGGVTFTTRELYCDGYIALASTEVTAPEDMLLCMEPYDAIGANGDNGEELARQLGVAPNTTWLEAASHLQKRLVSVRAILELPPEITDGEAMEDILYSESGLTYFSMADMNGTATGEKISATLFLRAAEIDPATGEELSRETARETIDIYLEAPIDARDYAVEDGADMNGFRLTGVRGELYAAGLYLYATFTAPEGMTADSLWERYNPEYPIYLDADGQPYPSGASLSGGVNADSFPTVVLESMIPADTLPETLTLRLDAETVVTVR